MRTLGIVIPCYRQERFLPRTLAALDRLPKGLRADGVLVMAAPLGESIGVIPPRPSEWDAAPAGTAWRTLRPVESRGGAPLTPGAARMAGLAACGGDWILFVDADVEVDRVWLASALETIEAAERDDADRSRLAGLWGRIEEWFVDGGGERRGSHDLYHVGEAAREVPYLATLALYRRAALADAGGYDPRLRSEEDFELGLRLKAQGWKLRSLPMFCARHWSAPRPSFAELGRRWSTGLCFGQGQVLRLYLGRPGFSALLRRQALYLATLTLWTLGVVALIVSLTRAAAAPLIAWLALAGAALIVMAARKRSVRLAAHSLLTWTLNGLGLLVGWFRIDTRARREVRC